MTLTPTQVALVAIAERRNAAIKERDDCFHDGNTLGFQHEAGIVAGFQIALDILREVEDEDGNAVFHVASAEYLATHPTAQTEPKNWGQ